MLINSTASFLQKVTQEKVPRIVNNNQVYIQNIEGGFGQNMFKGKSKNLKSGGTATTYSYRVKNVTSNQARMSKTKYPNAPLRTPDELGNNSARYITSANSNKQSRKLFFVNVSLQFHPRK
jgi:hypothetical protein